jgi:hypothetical protein
MVQMRVTVKPNARVSALAQAADGSWVAQLKAPPVDGKANAELVALVAAHFGCPKSAVTIRGGATGRLKRLLVDVPGGPR